MDFFACNFFSITNNVTVRILLHIFWPICARVLWIISLRKQLLSHRVCRISIFLSIVNSLFKVAVPIDGSTSSSDEFLWFHILAAHGFVSRVVFSYICWTFDFCILFSNIVWWVPTSVHNSKIHFSSLC